MPATTINRTWDPGETRTRSKPSEEQVATGSFAPILSARVTYREGKSPSITGANFSLIVSIAWDAEASVYVGTIPCLLGCVSEGETREEARENLKSAFVDVMKAHRERGTVPPFTDSPEIPVVPSTLTSMHVNLDAAELETA